MVWTVVVWCVVLVVVAAITIASYESVKDDRRQAGKPPAGPLLATVLTSVYVLGAFVMLLVIYLILDVHPGALAAFLNGSGRYGD